MDKATSWIRRIVSTSGSWESDSHRCVKRHPRQNGVLGISGAECPWVMGVRTNAKGSWYNRRQWECSSTKTGKKKTSTLGKWLRNSLPVYRTPHLGNDAKYAKYQNKMMSGSKLNDTTTGSINVPPHQQCRTTDTSQMLVPKRLEVLCQERPLRGIRGWYVINLM